MELSATFGATSGQLSAQQKTVEDYAKDMVFLH